jgi:hypothetical protein
MLGSFKFDTIRPAYCLAAQGLNGINFTNFTKHWFLIGL